MSLEEDAEMLTLGSRAAHLRAEFDETFRLAPRLAREDRESILLIRAGGQTLGLRLCQVDSVVKDKRITPLPGSPPDLLGLAGLRGSLAAVYDLASLLGSPRAGKDVPEARWIALVGGSERGPLALAFEALEGQLESRADSLLSMPSGRHLEGLLEWRDRTLPVLSVDSLLDELSGRRGRAG